MESLLDGSTGQLQPWRRRRSARFWLAVLSPLVLLGACGCFVIKAKKAASEAEREAVRFHQRFAAAQYDAIYDGAAPGFRAAVTRADSIKYFAAIHDKIGACRQPAWPLTSFANATPNGTTVRLEYRLECGSGVLEEAFVFAVSAEGARLLFHHASSAFGAKQAQPAIRS